MMLLLVIIKPSMADRPKVMIPVAGKTVLRRLVDKFKAQGINDITVVGGYHSEAIDVQGARTVVNDAWESSDELVSLSCALEAVADDTVLIYGDLLFRTYILNNLMDWDSDLLVVVDSSPLDDARGNKNDLAFCSAPDDRAMYQQKVSLERISSDRSWGGRRPDGCSTFSAQSNTLHAQWETRADRLWIRVV